MKKMILLSSVILTLNSFPANAGGFSLNIFTPAPIHVVEPRPVYVHKEYRTVYANPHPRYNYQDNYWYYDNYKAKHRNKRHNYKHERKQRRHKQYGHGYRNSHEHGHH